MTTPKVVGPLVDRGRNPVPAVGSRLVLYYRRRLESALDLVVTSERACDRLVGSASVAPSPPPPEVPGSIICGDEFRWIFQDFLVAFNTY